MSPLHAVFLLIDNCVAILPAEETVSLLLYLRKSSWSEQRKTFMMLLICLHHLNRNVITGFLRNAVCTWSNWHKATKHTTYSVQQIFRPKYWQTLFEGLQYDAFYPCSLVLSRPGLPGFINTDMAFLSPFQCRLIRKPVSVHPGNR